MARGIQKLDVAKFLPNIKQNIYPSFQNFCPSLIDINVSGQILGTYTTKEDRSRAFIWEQGQAKDFNIDDELFTCGYQVINIIPKQINDKGNIFGSFEYGYKHPLKNIWVKEGTIDFFWNGKVHFIDVPDNFNIYGLNNNDEILIHNNECSESICKQKTYVWQFDKGLRLVIDGFQPCHPCIFNDHCNMIVTNGRGEIHHFENGNIVDLKEQIKQTNIKNPSEFSMNNNGVIVGLGLIWGETHVFALWPERT